MPVHEAIHRNAHMPKQKEANNQLSKKDVYNHSSQQNKLAAAAAVAAAAAFAASTMSSLSPGSNSKQSNFFPILMGNSELAAKKD